MESLNQLVARCKVKCHLCPLFEGFYLSHHLDLALYHCHHCHRCHVCYVCRSSCFHLYFHHPLRHYLGQHLLQVCHLSFLPFLQQVRNYLRRPLSCCFHRGRHVLSDSCCTCLVL